MLANECYYHFRMLVKYDSPGRLGSEQGGGFDMYCRMRGEVYPECVPNSTSFATWAKSEDRSSADFVSTESGPSPTDILSSTP